MNPDKREQLIHVLKERITAQSHINRSREEIAVLTTGDEFERLQLASDRDVLLHAVSHESATLHEMHAALRRLENGVYGVCLACGQEISPKRLAAIPWVAYCIECQEELERETTDIADNDFLREAA